MNGVLLPDKTYDLEPDSVERKTIGIMTKLWTNFAKFGYEFNWGSSSAFGLNPFFFYFHFKSRNPFPNSNERLNNLTTTAVKTKFNYFDITNDGLVMKTNPNEANHKFWNDIFEEYSQYWTPKIFTYNSMAVKVPLAILCSLLLLIGFCKLIGMCKRQNKRRKSMAP